MSYQQMESEEIQAGQQGYTGVPPSISYNLPTAGQKLSKDKDSGTSALSSGHRLALAIVSLVLWIVVFLIVVGIITATPTHITEFDLNGVPRYIDNFAHFYVVTFIITFGFVLLNIMIIFLNVLAGRKR